MLRFKNSVQCPKSVIIVAAAHNARTALGFPGDTYVTSMNDSIHMPESKHYTDEAADFRTKDLTDVQVKQWAAAVRARLGHHFDVVIETDHLHIEHDQK